MELPIYDNLKDFRDNYHFDFSEFECSFLNYLRECKKQYTENIYFFKRNQVDRKELQRIINKLDHRQNLTLHRMLFKQYPEYGAVSLFPSYFDALNELEPTSKKYRFYINLYSDSYNKELNIGTLDGLQKILNFIELQIENEKKSNIEFGSKNRNTINTLGVDELAREVFSGDLTKLDLLKYFNENFNSVSQRFTDKTKYNQIYFFLQGLDADIQIPKNQYKLLIKLLFGFDYESADVKGITEKHQRTLGHYYFAFKESDS